MAKMDMHVHSSCSEHPSEWFLKRLGTRESYVPPETVYRLCKAAGMDFVTLTDHNSIDGALELRVKHPQDTIVGVESTTYFLKTEQKSTFLFTDWTNRNSGKSKDCVQAYTMCAPSCTQTTCRMRSRTPRFP